MSGNRNGSTTGPTTAARAQSLGEPDDPRVASVLAAYLAELEAGRRPSRDEFLGCYPDIARSLADWFDIVEFVHSAAESGYPDRPKMPCEDALPPETMLGEYRLVRELGRGGMGIVYEATQVSLGRRVALKVLSGTAALDQLKLQRFRVETQAVAQLNHPHIVPIFAVGSERGSHFYAMQYIEGPTLAEVIHQQRRFGRSPAKESEGGQNLPESGAAALPSIRVRGSVGYSSNESGEQAPALASSGHGASGTSSFRPRGAFRALAKLAIQAAEALAHAHSMGILHRDIKPSNLLVDSRGNLWVTDFGLARFQDEPGLTRTGDLLGTLRYMAPELLLGHRMVHDPRSDGYSLGATLYELLTLTPVFDGRDRPALLRQIAQEEPVPPSRIDPTIPRDLETIVLKAMDKEPDRRYATADDLAQDLRRYLEDKPIQARRPTTVERAAKWARRHRLVLMTTAAVAFLALAIATPMLWWEQRKTAEVNKNLSLTFEQADRGFEQITHLSDELTMMGMSRYSEFGQSPEAISIRADFFRQAIEFYERLLDKPQVAKPIKALAYRRLGFARMVGTQDPRAQAEFQRSATLYDELLAESPGNAELRRAQSDVQLSVGMYLMFTRGINEATATFRRVKSMDEGLVSEFPDDLESLELLTHHSIQTAVWMGSSGMRDQAEQVTRELLAIYKNLAARASGSPGGARTWAASYHRLGRRLEQAGRFREGQEALREGLKITGQSPDLLNDLALSLVAKPDAPLQDSAEALELAKRALELNPKEGAFWNTLGLAYLRAAKWTLAAEAVKKSMELLSPEGRGAADQLLMAMISWRRGEKDAAIDWYIQALEGMSKYPHADTFELSLRAEAAALLKRSTK